MKVVEEGMTGEDLDLMLESMLFATELLIPETHYLQVALIVILLTHSTCISPKLELGAVQFL